jgi:hypothetical protein
MLMFWGRGVGMALTLLGGRLGGAGLAGGEGRGTGLGGMEEGDAEEEDEECEGGRGFHEWKLTGRRGGSQWIDEVSSIAGVAESGQQTWSAFGILPAWP